MRFRVVNNKKDMDRRMIRVGGAGCLRITYCNEIMPISPRRYEETVLDCIWPPDLLR
jgi:putative NADH-flavin reductase